MFAGLTDGDFESYAPKKWKSNMYNRERLEVRQKLLALGRDLSPRMVATDGSLLTLEASVEHPAASNHKQVEAQHLFFSRNEAARKELDKIIERGQSLASRIDDNTPQHNHLFLALTIAHDRLEVALRLHPDARVDRQNLERKCEDHFEREKLITMLRRLPGEWQFGLSTGQSNESMAPTANADVARLAEVLAALAAPPPLSIPGTPVRLLQVVHAIPRAQATQAGPDIAATIEATFAALLPAYHFVAWSRDNDYVSIRDVLQKEKTAKRQRGLAKNDEVRVVRGMLNGQLGVVQEIDARGGVRLLVGKMSVKVDAEDVVKS